MKAEVRSRVANHQLHRRAALGEDCKDTILMAT